MDKVYKNFCPREFALEKELNGHTFSKINVECYKMKSGIEKNKGEKGGRGTLQGHSRLWERVC